MDATGRNPQTLQKGTAMDATNILLLALGLFTTIFGMGL